MARNKSKIETIIIALILLIGLTGAFFMFSGNDEAAVSPGHSLENPSAVYQVSMVDQPQ
jgi:flagellar basal body-associated protein FliL